MGFVYRPKLKGGGRSRVWWCKYYVNGRPIRESTSARKEKDAKLFLKKREGKAASGEPILPRVDRIRYEEVAADLRSYYETTGRRKLKEADARLKRLEAFFRHRRVAAIGPADITAYVAKRQTEKVANGTINRELATLSRMLRLAYENGKLLRLPVIRRPKESGPRQGFFERELYEAVRRHLPEDLRVAVAIAHSFGWRVQSEILTLERRHLDLAAGTLRLDPGTTKNDEGRVVYLTPELKSLLASQLERVEALQRQLGRITPFLFPHLRGRRRGQRRKDIGGAWARACKLAACPGMRPHDFRRTAVRNMVNAGVPERVAMKITGHKTRSVFDRYHIVSPGDLKDAARKIAGTFSGTSAASAPTSTDASVRS